MDDPLFVVVSGPPGSGKSTLAAVLAAELALPLLAKDTVKEALLCSLPVADVGDSRRVGRAAMDVLFALAASSPPGAVLEANFHRTPARRSIHGLPGRTVELFCRCPREVARARYRGRIGSRDPGHFDADRGDDELWHPEVTEPVAGGWPVVEVDTTGPVGVSSLLDRLAAALGGTEPLDSSAPRVGRRPGTVGR